MAETKYGHLVKPLTFPGGMGGANAKLLPLKELVVRYVKPGMTLHLACGLGGPTAATYEIVRQYRGENPQFVLIQSVLIGPVLNLIHCHLVRKLIFAASAASGQSRRVIQKAYAEKKIELENWSLCSLQQRLMAGALGVSFMPTRSITGSSLVSENKESFKEIKDPFGVGEKVGVVRALNPDISIVHGCVADEYGNTILAAPYGDDIWGPLASTSGVLVTVEKIVPTAFIRKHAALVKIPGHIVNAVSVAPLGAHPFALPNPGISDFAAYRGDEEFLQDFQAASADSDQLDGWIKEWVLGCPTPEKYLSKLGGKRISALRHYAPPFSPPPKVGQGYTPEEVTAVVAAREIIKSARKAKHCTMLAGAGAGLLAAWLAYYQLSAKGYEIGLMQGNGQIGYLPPVAGRRPSRARMLTDTITTHGVFVGGKNSRCLSLLGAGEIDKYGNINSTRTAQGQFLSGSGGANDAANAREVIVVLEQSRKRFVKKLSFVTCPGYRVTKVISNMGVWEKPVGKRELRLSACFPTRGGASQQEQIKQVQKNCGWSLKSTARVKEVPPPSPDELGLLRSLSPAAMV